MANNNKRVCESIDFPINKKGSKCDTTWLIDALFNTEIIHDWFSIGKGESDKQQVLKKYAQAAGFRVSMIANPRAGVSLYMENPLFENNIGATYDQQLFWLMIGLHPNQDLFEEAYQSHRNRFIALEVIRQLRSVSACIKSKDVMEMFESIETKINENKFSATAFSEDDWKKDIVTTLVDKAAYSESLVLRDLDRTIHRNCTLSNCLLGIFIKLEKIFIHSITLKRNLTPTVIDGVTSSSSSNETFSRLNIFLYDENTDYSKPLPFLFKPKVTLLFQQDGLDTLLSSFTNQFWRNVEHAGYVPCETLTAPFSPLLKEWVKSGVLLSNGCYETAASFEPKNVPLSMYLCGSPGAGKSSFVRALTTALGTTLNEIIDPQMDVRLVKFNLNKPLQVLKKELQLRPNNNDLSVMSIIQGRRQTFAQVKRGIVLIALEEVPSSSEHQTYQSGIISRGNIGDGIEGACLVEEEGEEQDVMEQESTLEHLSSRFIGIDKDTTLLPVFTSNYELSETSRKVLAKLSMFKNMTEIKMGGVHGKDRVSLSHSLIESAIHSQWNRRLFTITSTLTELKCESIKMMMNRFKKNASFNSIRLSQSIVQEGGDIRPLRYKLNTIAFFVSLALYEEAVENRIKLRQQASSSSSTSDVARVAESLANESGTRNSADDASYDITLSVDQSRQGMIDIAISSNDPWFSVHSIQKQLYIDDGNCGCYPPLNSYSFYDERTSIVYSSLQEMHTTMVSSHGANADDSNGNGLLKDLSQVSDIDIWRIAVIVDLFFSRALCPSVIVFKDKPYLSSALVRLLCGQSINNKQGISQVGVNHKALKSSSKLTSFSCGDGSGVGSQNLQSSWCESVLDIDPATMNMVRSLYDSKETRNLRDDIMFAKANSKEGNVCVEIVNMCEESQLLMRELVEDSPSMTSFSTTNSALYKDGVFFIVNLNTDQPLTPEFKSRTSLVI